jgi:hypothetical protein
MTMNLPSALRHSKTHRVKAERLRLRRSRDRKWELFIRQPVVRAGSKPVRVDMST